MFFFWKIVFWQKRTKYDLVKMPTFAIFLEEKCVLGIGPKLRHVGGVGPSVTRGGVDPSVMSCSKKKSKGKRGEKGLQSAISTYFLIEKSNKIQELSRVEK